MGMNATGILAYGYDLGGRDGVWNVNDADEFGDLDTDWANEEDPADAITELLAAELPSFTEDDTAPGVKLGFYGDSMAVGGTGYLLMTRQFESLSDPKGDMDLSVDSTWDEQLRQAMAVLGVTPAAPPQWILAGSYG